MTRRLVITADDLGRDEATTAVIAALLAEGHVTAATLITIAPGSERAAEQARRLGVGPHLHITLTSEAGLPPWRWLTGGSGRAAPDVLREMDAQLRWMHGRGLRPAAADSHAGVLYGLSDSDGADGSLLSAALRWCARHGLAFRLPRDARLWWGGPLPPPLAAAHEQAVALADALGVPLPAAIVTNRHSAAELGGYATLRNDLIARLAELPDGTSELFLHPSAEDAVAGPAGVVRAWEARLLRDPAWHRALATEGIEVVSQW